MATTRTSVNLTEASPDRSREPYLYELLAQFNRLPLNSPARALLAVRIRQVEAEIDARSGT